MLILEIPLQVFVQTIKALMRLGRGAVLYGALAVIQFHALASFSYHLNKKCLHRI